MLPKKDNRNVGWAPGIRTVAMAQHDDVRILEISGFHLRYSGMMVEYQNTRNKLILSQRIRELVSTELPHSCHDHYL